MDLSKRLANAKEYKINLRKSQWRLLHLQNVLHQNKIATIMVMEGWDAAGKGGVIKRITEYLDPRGVKVWSIAAPEPHEQRYHYLHRFWRKIPRYGEITILIGLGMVGFLLRESKVLQMFTNGLVPMMK